MARRCSALEGLGLTQFGDIYRQRRVLLTGHTGFKGSWLALWLQALGARATGIALPPEQPQNHWDLLNLEMPSVMLDIRDGAALRRIVKETRPEIVFHLAAQALVRRSYCDPVGTFETNVIGTINLLEACRAEPGIRAIVVVTSDKCYANRECIWSYREGDALGGHDPYSASKAAAELAVASYRNAFFSKPGSTLVATARAGNVIGGGDWSEDRLVPDIVRATIAGRSLELRCPQSTRPWQHVLEPLAGYLLLGQRLLEGQSEFADAWNFGPSEEANQRVLEVVEGLQRYWPELAWHQSNTQQPHEATYLHLDSTKARRLLGWRPKWNLPKSLEITASWYREYRSAGAVLSHQQLEDYGGAFHSVA